MKRFTCLAFVMIIFSSSCISIPREDLLMGQGRNIEAAQYMENKFRDIEMASESDLWKLCNCYYSLKDYDKLFSCLDEMKKRIDRGDDTIRVEYDIVWMGDIAVDEPIMRAQAWLEFGDYQKAIDNVLKASQVAYEMYYEPEYKKALALLGMAYALKGDRENARKYRDELNKSGMGSSLGVAKINIALGNYDLALKALEQDLAYSGIIKAFVSAMTTVATGTTIDQRFWALHESPKDYLVSKIFLETGDIAKAKKGFDGILSIPQIAENGEIYWMTCFDRGRIAEIERDHAQAIELYGRAIEVIEEQRSTINTEVSKIGFVGDKQEVYSQIISLLFEQTRYSEAFEYVERAKARALVDMLASRKQFIRADVSIQEASDLIAKLDTAESEAKMQDVTSAADQSSKQRAVVVKRKEEIRNADPELASLVTVTSPEVAEIQQLLPSDETLVEYFGSGDSLFAFIVNREGIQGAKLEAKELKQEIERFRKHIMALDSYQFKTGGQALYEKLIQPIEGMIGSKNLTIVPHGALHYLPFNALHDKDGFLIDRYNIRILPSASVMKFLKDRREGHAGNLLAFGNPDLGDPTYDLPGAQNEAIAITKDNPKSKLLLRKQATETAVKILGDQFRYIHFATHGTFDAEKPLSSGLLLAGDSENDGTLTVGELYDLHLPADLVTLSACETALGKVANGDDVVGFTRGFLYAGVSSIVSSLWKVDDQATSILMQQFYKSLKETDKRSALRTAQLKVKDTYNSHPYFWAAFQITGSLQ